MSVALGKNAVLNNISGEFKVGINTLFGINGSGKTTLLRTIATLIKPVSGTISLDQAIINESRISLHSYRKNLGYLPQKTIFSSNFTVLEAVEYAAWLHRIPRPKRQKEVSTAIEQTALIDYKDKPLRTLSGGTKQRVYIAQAIVHMPRVLLLDEPTASLDLLQINDLLDSLEQISQECIVIISAHETLDILNFSKQVTILNRGSIGYQGSPEVFRDGETGIQKLKLALAGREF